MTRGSNPPPPAQWNLQGWMAAYHAAQRDPNSSPVSRPQVTQEPKKEEEEEMSAVTGGWRYEKSQGKDIEKPPIIRICPRCQGPPFPLKPTEESHTKNWCQDCRDGKPGPGQIPS
jgi:hypothetical protein